MVDALLRRHMRCGRKQEEVINFWVRGGSRQAWNVCLRITSSSSSLLYLYMVVAGCWSQSWWSWKHSSPGRLVHLGPGRLVDWFGTVTIPLLCACFAIRIIWWSILIPLNLFQESLKSDFACDLWFFLWFILFLISAITVWAGIYSCRNGTIDIIAKKIQTPKTVAVYPESQRALDSHIISTVI
jgi:hypothetical protein